MPYPAAPEIPINQRPLWSRLADRFPNEKECLAAYVALETAEVLAEAKPASLLSISNRTRACGRNLYEIWKNHGSDLLTDTPLVACKLVDRGNSMMLLFYHKELFGRHLARRDISALLRRAGYREPIDVEDVLRHLVAQLQAGCFPHEIGLLLGYPAKDVAAFMGWIRLPFTCQGPWKIYGKPGESLKLAENFRRCRKLMAARLSQCASAIQCLGGHAGSSGIFTPSY